MQVTIDKEGNETIRLTKSEIQAHKLVSHTMETLAKFRNEKEAEQLKQTAAMCAAVVLEYGQ